MRLDDMRTDPALEKEGAWVQWRGDVRLKVRRANNPEYRAAVTEGLRPYRALIRADALPQADADRVNWTALGSTVLVDWEGILDRQFKPIPYSVERSQEYMNDPTLHDLRDFVIWQSSLMDTFRKQEQEADLGNSPSFSNGASSGDPSRSSSEPSPVAASPSQPSNGSPTSQGTSRQRGKPSASTSAATSG